MIVHKEVQVTCRGCGEQFTLRTYKRLAGWWGDHHCEGIRNLMIHRPRIRKLFKETIGTVAEALK